MLKRMIVGLSRRAGALGSTFNSIWRRESDGGWKVVFDKGCPPCAR